jgi:thiamine-phosphate pyrophosphorylase
VKGLPPLHAICDADVCERAGWTVPELASACLDGGATCLQIRAKHAPSDWLLQCVDSVVTRARHYEGALVIVNDRADIARAAGASGVHVGQDDLPPAAVRRILGDQALVGLSTHTAAQLENALAQPISYVAIGPVFQTDTKRTGREAFGLDGVRARAGVPRSRRLQVVAIGGITLERAPSVMNAGADAVAVITDLLAGGDPRARVAAYVRVLSKV